MQGRQSLTELAFESLRETVVGTKDLEESVEIVVFGSVAAGLERPDSDIDIFCVSKREFKLKTDRLDLIVMPVEATRVSLWLQSELACHIAEYGTWIKGPSRWRTEAQIGHKAIDAKCRRIGAFLRALPDSWTTLDEGFRVKYSVKLRRETQRLLLMERGTPVPPTRILDSCWGSMARTPYELHDRLRRLTVCCHGVFTRDLFARIDAAFPTG